MVLGRLGPQGGCAAEQESWAAGGKNELGHRGRISWAESKENKGRKRKRFANSEGIQTNEFKHRFEFNLLKIVLQHECNNKLLWFIYLIKNN
jgi:hypothetical protein